MIFWWFDGKGLIFDLEAKLWGEESESEDFNFSRWGFFKDTWGFFKDTWGFFKDQGRTFSRSSLNFYDPRLLSVIFVRHFSR